MSTITSVAAGGLYPASFPLRDRSRPIRLALWTISLGLILLYWSTHHKRASRASNSQTLLRSSSSAFLPSKSSSVIPNSHLIVVPGHALYVPATRDWIIDDWMAREGLGPMLLEHVEKGVDLAFDSLSANESQQEAVLLVFSGGATREIPEAARSRLPPRWTEALGYDAAATERRGKQHEKLSRRNATDLENHARDSMENLLYSLCRFRARKGGYPARVSLVGFHFKRKRFEDAHAAALRLPDFRYVGMQEKEIAKYHEEMEETVMRQFRRDPFGCMGELRRKKLRRDVLGEGPAPYRRNPEAFCPELRSVMTYCGPGPFPGKYPWES